jgi:hypothetical protein
MAISALGMAYPRPALTLRPSFVDPPIVVGVLFDPFPSYGTDPEAELTRHRALTLQFGLESVVETDPIDAPGSAVELCRNAVRWVTEEVTLRVTPTLDGQALTLTADAASANGAVTVTSFDFGDGSPAVTGTDPSATHTYERFGTYPVVVVVRSDLDGAAVWRQDLYVAPGTDGGVVGDGGSGDAGPAPPFEATCGGCHAAGPGGPAGALALGLLALLGVRAAGRAGRGRATRGRWGRR